MNLKTPLLLAALSAAATTTAQECDYSSNRHCIKAELTVNTTIPFAPLFPTLPTFVYGVDELSADDLKTARERDEISTLSIYSGPVLKIGWWLAYDNSTLDLSPAQNREYYAFALETNTTSPVGGDVGGCAGLVGGECVKNLKDVIAAKTFAASYLVGGMAYVLDQLRDSPLRNLSCPEDIFGTPSGDPVVNAQKPLLLDGFHEFAKVSDERVVTPPPPGNASFTYAFPQYRFRSLEEHKTKGVVVMTVSWPVVDAVVGQPLNYTMDDVKVETACFRLGAPGSPGGENGGGGENGASNYRASRGLVMVVVGALLVLF